jgi:hypothetical protein
MTKAHELECEERILERLTAAGSGGLTKTQLKLPSSGSERGKVCQAVLTRLEKQGKIGDLGTKAGHRYVMAQYYRPLEMAYEHVESIARDAGMTLRSKSYFEKGLSGAVIKKIDEALKLLVGEGKLLRLRWSSYPVYLHASALPKMAMPPQPAGVESSVDQAISNADVLRAYHETVAELGYPDVLIHEVFLRLGGDLDAFKTYLMDACRQGRALASVGDWSLSSPEERKAALYINGQPHLRIRFEG